MVVGGYGAVGRLLCKELSQERSIDIVVAGRRLDAAEVVAGQLDGRARRIDLLDPESWQKACGGIEVVVMCMDQNDTRFVAYLFERGIRYVDITASDGFFRELERMEMPPDASALLSVGLAPGLTNIMVAHCAGKLHKADEAEIGLMSGLGDTHGTAALEWLADQLFDPSKETHVGVVDFADEWGAREVHAVDFSDQHALMRTLAIGRVTTSVCLDSRLATQVLFGFARLFRGSRLAKRLLILAVERFHMGSTVCNVSVAVAGQRDGVAVRVRAHFRAQSETSTTAWIAAVMVLSFIHNPPPSGIWHGHQILDPETIYAEIERRGIGRISVEDDRSPVHS